MEAIIASGDITLSMIKPLFPVENIETAVEVMRLLLHLPTNDEPNLALCSFFFCLTKKMIGFNGKKVLKSDSREARQKISFEELKRSWAKFIKLIRAHRKWIPNLKNAVEPLSKVSSVVLGIYDMIEKVALIGEKPSDCGGLDALVEALNNLSSKNFVKDTHISFDLSEVKVFTVVVAQTLGLTDVHLHLSEKRVFLGVGEIDETGSGLVDIKKYEENSLPKFSDKRANQKNGWSSLPPLKDLWICSGGHFVHCDRFIEVAYMCCDLQYHHYPDNAADLQMADFQRGVLAILKNRLNRYPMGLAMYGNLESKFGDPETAESLHINAIESNQQLYSNSYVFPYCFYMEHLIRNNRFAPALVAIELASKVASNYVYVNDFDKALHDELYKIAQNHLNTIFSNLERQRRLKDPSLTTLLLAFMDNLCLWEEKGKLDIIHSLWLKALMKELQKVSGNLTNIIFHASPEVFLASTKHTHPRKRYLQSMITGLESAELSGDLLAKEVTLPEEIDASFCQFALNLYVEWPPLRATESYLDHESEIYILPKQRSDDPELYEKMLEKFRNWRCDRKISAEDLRRIAQFRPVNPLYELCCGLVFPFLDMGPGNVAMSCFDFVKMKKELLVPRPGTTEFAVMAAFSKRYFTLTGMYFPDTGTGNGCDNRSAAAFQAAPVPVSQVLMRSRKMQSIQSLLESTKFNPKEIQLTLSANASEGSSKRRVPKQHAG